MDNIEQLKLETDTIKKSLNELKDNVSISEDDKRNKANLLNSRAEKTKQKIQKEIDSLTDKTDEESKKKKEEAEALLNSFNDITALYNSIINPSSNPETQNPDQIPAENKNIITTATDWVKTQRNDILDTGKWKTEGGKNLLRTTLFAATGVGAVGLVYKGAKSLWNWAFGSDKKKKKTESKGGTWYGKLLKWAGITTAAGGGVYFLGKHFNRWGNTENQTENNTNQTENNVDNPPTQQQENNIPETPQQKSNETKDTKENLQSASNEISNDMFEQLLKMEGKHEEGDKLVAKTGKQFGEKFTTGPYGMVYKHIDNNGNLLKKSVHFKEGETVTKEWAIKNAKACYDKRAKEIKEAFDKKGYNLSQNQLDALTSTCGGTSASRKNCLNFVLDNRNDQNKVVKYISTHSTTAAGNGQVQPGLVYRRKFEADWFVGNKMTFAEHRAMQKKGYTYDTYLAKNGTQKDKNIG